MVFTVDEIRQFIEPVARQYRLRAVYLFGSYARGDADADSDIDLLIDRTGSDVRGMLDMGSLYNALREACGKEIDLVTTHTLRQAGTLQRVPAFVENLEKERKNL